MVAHPQIHPHLHPIHHQGILKYIIITIIIMATEATIAIIITTIITYSIPVVGAGVKIPVKEVATRPILRLMEDLKVIKSDST